MRTILRASMLPFFLFAIALLPAGSLAWADNEGLADLDQATEAKLLAENFQDLSNVVQKVETALEKGLDEDNTKFAHQLLSATLFQRASILTTVIFNQDRPDPRWVQLRNVALVDLARSVQLNSKQAEAYFLIGRLHTLPGGDGRQALKALDRVVAQVDAKNPLLVKTLLLRAGLHAQDADRVADLNRAVELAPDEAETYRTRGVYYLLKEDFKKSIADLKKAAELQDDEAGTYEALGMALMMDDKIDAGIAALDKAIRLEPDLPTPYAHRARAHAMQGDNKAALADLDKALEIDPTSLQTLLLRSQVHAQEGDSDKALADAERALRIRPNHVSAARLKAELLANAGKVPEAIAELERMAPFSPNNTALTMQLAIYYLADKQPRRAIALLNKVLSAESNNWLALLSRGDAYLSLGEHAKAIADYRAAEKLKPDNSGLLNNLAWVLATSPDDKLRNGKEALDFAQEACELTEYKKAHILSTLAAAYAEVGNWEKAVEWAQKAVEAGKDSSQKEQLAEELASYREKKPWRESQNVEQEKAAEPNTSQPTPGHTSKR